MTKRFPFLDLATINTRYADRLKSAAVRVIDSGRYIGGDEVTCFNNSLAELCQAPHAIGTSNGLDALRLILEAYKILGRLRSGDEVIVAGNTYIASVLAITHAGLTPVLVDPDPDSMNISAQSIENALSSRTKAIMAVHLYGRVAWDSDIAAIAHRHNLLVVEDAAQAIGAQANCNGLYGSRMAGALGHAGAFSFYPTKNIGALGDAGAVVTHDIQLADAVRALANYGSDRRYHNIYAGFNCRLDPIQAAMLSEKLKDTILCAERRVKKAELYHNTIKNPIITTPGPAAGHNSNVWHQYVIRTASGRRDELRSYLLANGIETDIHYPTPPHLQPCYSGFRFRPLPITEQLAQTVVSLPISDCTSESDIIEISEIINRFR